MLNRQTKFTTRPSWLRSQLVMPVPIVHELCFTCSWLTLNQDPTIWVVGACPANTCILLFYLLIAARTICFTHYLNFPLPLSCYELLQVLIGQDLRSPKIKTLFRVIHDLYFACSWMTEANLTLGFLSLRLVLFNYFAMLFNQEGDAPASRWKRVYINVNLG